MQFLLEFIITQRRHSTFAQFRSLVDLGRSYFSMIYLHMHTANNVCVRFQVQCQNSLAHLFL